MKFCALCDRTYADDAEVCTVDGVTLRMVAPKQDPLVGAALKGRYRILRKLGEGGMGAVYLAEQFSVKRKVALKILHPNYAQDQDFVRRFRQEATLAASFSHHNAITVFDFDQSDDGRLYIVMEYVDGESLSALIKNHPLPLDRALRLGIQVAEGLSAAHRAGIIHRDIKPENIMVLLGDDHVKLMDFGIARLRDSTATTKITQPGMIMGTPAYMAPEQIQGGEITERTDIYSFGIVLYELLTRRVPFVASTPSAILFKHLHESPRSVRKIRNEIPPSVERIVSRALQKAPDKRFSSMEEVVQALKTAHHESARTQTYKPGIAPSVKGNLRRSVSSLALPFKKLFAKRSRVIDEEQSPDNDPVISSSGVTEDLRPESLARSTHLRKLPEDHSRLNTLAEAPAPEMKTLRDPQGWQFSTQNTLDTPVSTEHFAATVALTDSFQGPEVNIEQSQNRNNTPKNAEAAISTEKMFGLKPHRDIESSAEILRTEREIFAPGQAERVPNIIPGHSTIASRLEDTIAETRERTQAVAVEPRRKKPMRTSLAASVALVLSGAIAWVVYRSLPVETKPDAKLVDTPYETQASASRPGTPTPSEFAQEDVGLRDAAQPAADPPKDVFHPANPPRPLESKRPIGAREDHTKEVSGAKTSSPTKPEKTKTDQARIALPETIGGNKAQDFVREDKRPGTSSSAKADRDQEVSRKAGVAPERNQASDPKNNKEAVKEPPAMPMPDKKPYEPTSAPQIASIPRAETPTPTPPSARIELKNLSIVAKKKELSVPESVVLTAKGIYSDGTEIDIKTGVEWKSSDATVASVNSRGEVQALREGTTQISAMYQGVPSSAYTFNVKRIDEKPNATEENSKASGSRGQMKDLRRGLLR